MARKTSINIMKTTVDNNYRKFWIAGTRPDESQVDIICNLKDIPVITPNLTEYTIRDLVNRKWRRCSKLHINAMLLGQGIFSSI